MVRYIDVKQVREVRTPVTRDADWLLPLRGRLERAPSPVLFFFRDDDIGYDDAALWPLLDLFARRHVPLDLAVIPALITPALANETRARCDGSGGRLRVHQHGWRHANHEAAGRKCEFGPSRNLDRQRDNLRMGRAALSGAFGAHVDPIFTPPWNRCVQGTVDLVADEGFRALSRNAEARPLDTGALVEIPVTIDWQRMMNAPAERRGTAIDEAVADLRPVGVMLHHAAMTADDRQHLAALLDLLAGHANASCVTMMECVSTG